MKKVCICVGHWQIEQLDQATLRSWRDASILRKSTGATGERDWHWNQWMPKLRDKLIQAGIQVYIVDSVFRQEIYSQNFDLWIAGHYDAGGTGERCMVSTPNRDTKPSYLNEAAFREAERFAAIWKETYPQITGIPHRDDFVTAGMKDYYAFDFVGMDTPAVIVEHFNNTSQKGQELRNNPDLVVEADFRAILKFLGMEQPVQDETYKIVFKGQTLATYETNPEDKINDLDTKLKAANESLAGLQAANGALQTNLTRQEQDNSDLLGQLTETRKKRDEYLGELNEANGNLQDRDTTITTLTNKVKALESKNPLAAYTGWQLIKLGVKKLGKK